MNTVLHRDGDQFAIVTTAESEDEFRQQFSAALAGALADGQDAAFELDEWLKPATEIICKLRGYKSAVVEQRTLIAGHLDPQSPQVTVDRHSSNGTKLKPIAA